MSKFFTMVMDKSVLNPYLNDLDFKYFSFRYEKDSSNNFSLACAAMDIYDAFKDPIKDRHVPLIKGPLSANAIPFDFLGALILERDTLRKAGFGADFDLSMEPVKYTDGSTFPGNRNYISYHITGIGDLEPGLVSPFSLNPSPPRNP